MDSSETEVIYFSSMGPSCTEETLHAARRRAEQLGIKSIVVASTTGETGRRASELFKGYNLVVVTHAYGFKAPDTQELTEENRKQILANGAKILTTTHAFGGVGRAIRRKFQTMQVDEVIANTLRIFGEGIKVACEIAAMAVDSGLVRSDEDLISIGGSSRGSDTAIVARPANVSSFFEFKVREVICKPRL
jgi:hypothetical protein